MDKTNVNSGLLGIGNILASSKPKKYTLSNGDPVEEN